MDGAEDAGYVDEGDNEQHWAKYASSTHALVYYAAKDEEEATNGDRNSERQDGKTQNVESSANVPPVVRSAQACEYRDGEFWWNEQFQRLLEAPVTTPEGARQREGEIKNFGRKFARAAQATAMTIIQERFKEEHLKTIKPVNVGGVAGGEKFIANQMFFKFATDHDSWQLYGGDEFAAKAAGHELKSLNALIACNVPNLHFPLMATFDLFGHRVIAVSKLPISGSTLVYGSADGGIKIYDSAKVKSMVMRACLNLNLRGHTVIERSSNRRIFLYGPVDLEGHLGTDGRYYIVDTARLFPPQTRVPGVRGSHLYKLFRCEYLKKHPVPLSSDALTMWQTLEERGANDRDAVEATRALFSSVIPSLAKSLSMEQNFTPMSSLKDRCHKEGVGMRSLGYLWSCLTVPGCSSNSIKQAREVLAEMVAREFRALLNASYRASVKRCENPIDCTVQLLNLLCGYEPKGHASFAECKTLWNTLAVGADARFFQHKKVLKHELHASFNRDSDSILAGLEDCGYLDSGILEESGPGIRLQPAARPLVASTLPGDTSIVDSSDDEGKPKTRPLGASRTVDDGYQVDDSSPDDSPSDSESVEADQKDFYDDSPSDSESVEGNLVHTMSDREKSYPSSSEDSRTLTPRDAEDLVIAPRLAEVSPLTAARITAASLAEELGTNVWLDVASTTLHARAFLARICELTSVRLPEEKRESAVAHMCATASLVCSAMDADDDNDAIALAAETGFQLDDVTVLPAVKHVEVGSFGQRAVGEPDEQDTGVFLQFYEDELSQRIATLGARHVQVAFSHVNIAEFLTENGHKSGRAAHRADLVLESALFHFNEALEIVRDDSDLVFEHAYVLEGVANLLERFDRLDEAQDFYEEALASKRKLLGEFDSSIAEGLGILAGLAFRRGDFDRAENLAAEAEAVLGNAEFQYGDKEFQLLRASLLNHQGNMHLAAQDFDNSDLEFQKSYEILLQESGPDSSEAAILNDNLAKVFFARGPDYDTASSMFRRSIATKESALGQHNVSTAESRDHLAISLVHRPNIVPEDWDTVVDEALALFTSALLDLRKQLGECHTAVATVLNNMAGLYWRNGDIDEAQSGFSDALRRLSTAGIAASHPLYGICRENLSRVRAKMEYSAVTFTPLFHAGVIGMQKHGRGIGTVGQSGSIPEEWASLFEQVGLDLEDEETMDLVMSMVSSVTSSSEMSTDGEELDETRVARADLPSGNVPDMEIPHNDASERDSSPGYFEQVRTVFDAPRKMWGKMFSPSSKSKSVAPSLPESDIDGDDRSLREKDVDEGDFDHDDADRLEAKPTGVETPDGQEKIDVVGDDVETPDGQEKIDLAGDDSDDSDGEPAGKAKWTLVGDLAESDSTTATKVSKKAADLPPSVLAGSFFYAPEIGDEVQDKQPSAAQRKNTGSSVGGKIMTAKSRKGEKKSKKGSFFESLFSSSKSISAGSSTSAAASVADIASAIVPEEEASAHSGGPSRIPFDMKARLANLSVEQKRVLLEKLVVLAETKRKAKKTTA